MSTTFCNIVRRLLSNFDFAVHHGNCQLVDAPFDYRMIAMCAFCLLENQKVLCAAEGMATLK